MLLDLSKTQDNDLSAEVSLAAGEQLEVRLSEIPSSGYAWQVESLPNGLQFIGEGEWDPAKRSPSSEFRAGGSSVIPLKFQAETDVSGTLELACLRPWNPEDVARRCVVAVN